MRLITNVKHALEPEIDINSVHCCTDSTNSPILANWRQRLAVRFKVATNVGYVRPDGKWVTLYRSQFIVMNELGQVLAWQFTSSTSIDEVTDLLKNIHIRLQNQWVTPGKVFAVNWNKRLKQYLVKTHWSS